MNIIWLGHSGFRIELEDQVLLIDPWLGNPLFPEERRNEALKGVTQILITHGHGDHTAEALSIAKDLGVRIACIHELSEWLASQGAETLGFGKGGTIALGAVKVTMVNAIHSSSIDFKGFPVAHAGSEAGFMISGEGHTIYVSGDTDVTMDMGLWNELHHPDIGILACGGHYTMDMERAAFAARKFFNFRMVIPCHYKTFPLLEQSAEKLNNGLPGVRVVEPVVLEAIHLDPRT
jgi:L-ascorbate metabolism protein UlaG (beta-lactamase superfamily)